MWDGTTLGQLEVTLSDVELSASGTAAARTFSDLTVVGPYQKVDLPA